MDVHFFLNRRIHFIEQFYLTSSLPHTQRKRKIEAKEYPYIPAQTYADDEPAFLAEWIETDESLHVLGSACLSMLAAAFHLYFKTWDRQIGIQHHSSVKSAFKKHGWFNGYKKYYMHHFNLNFEDSCRNLALLEELVLARNQVQHPHSITSHSSHYSNDDLKKLPNPFFVDGQERELLNYAQDSAYFLIAPTIRVSAEKLKSALAEVTYFCQWLEDNHLPGITNSQVL